MGEAYFSAFAALAGSAIGALSGILTTWLTLTTQERARRTTQAMSRRENLYGDFIDEVAKLLTDALTHKLEDASKLVHVYALVSKMRLFASAEVLEMAEKVTQQLLRLYDNPEKELHIPTGYEEARNLDVLREFSEACRRDI